MYIRIAQRLTASLALRPPPPLGYLSPFYDASDCREGSVGNREQEDEWRHTHAYEVIADFLSLPHARRHLISVSVD